MTSSEFAGEGVGKVFDNAPSILLREHHGHSRSAGFDVFRSEMGVLMGLDTRWGDRVAKGARRDEMLAGQRAHQDAAVVAHHPLDLVVVGRV